MAAGRQREVSARPLVGRLLGTWLPFFYKDKARSFFVLPSLGGPPRDRETRNDGGIRLYYPEMKASLRLWEAYFEGLVQRGWTRLSSRA